MTQARGEGGPATRELPLRFERWPIWFKATIAIGALFLVLAVAQALVLRWAFADEAALLRARGQAPRPRVILALAVPLVLGTVGGGLLVGGLSRRRTRTIARALRRVADGDFTARLPVTPDRDFAVVREAFANMSAALDAAVRRLADADAQRRRLFADLAHELATPASAILGLLDTLSSPALCPDEATRARLLVALDGEVSRIARLVTDVRQLAALDDPDIPLHRSDADVAEIAQRAVLRLAAAGTLDAARVRLQLSAAPANVDNEQVEQLIVNLLSNAARYIPADGVIAVSVAPERGHVRLTVEDSGPGVPDEVLPRLGERLLRIDPARNRRTGGHGLGLSIVRAIAERHDGSVAFSRSPLGGLRAEVVLGRFSASPAARRAP